VWKESDVGYNEVLFEQLSEEQQLLKATDKSTNRVSSQIQTQTLYKLEQDTAHVSPRLFTMAMAP
jgi:hypothetical protein